MDTAYLTQSLKLEARRLGFALAGVCPAVTPVGFSHFLDWLDSGYGGEMNYLSARKEAYHHPNNVLPETKSLMMLGMNYRTTLAPGLLNKGDDSGDVNSGVGRVSRYAWGDSDYHDLIWSRLRSLESFAIALFQRAGLDESTVRGVIDTAPLLEREFAQLAGLGWQGKNTMLINRQIGSWFFIAAMLTNVELEYDQPFSNDHCGTCRACLDACPTNAFPEPGVLDATRCISYLTIEHRTAISPELRSRMGDWVFGCDVCQDVCPWNRKGPNSEEPAFFPLAGRNPLQIRELFTLTDEEFRIQFRKTPLWRPRRRGLLRNAAIVLGNYPDRCNLDSLRQGLHDVEPLIRGASAWALSKHLFPETYGILLERSRLELEQDVKAEILAAMEAIQKFQT